MVVEDGDLLADLAAQLPQVIHELNVGGHALVGVGGPALVERARISEREIERD